MITIHYHTIKFNHINELPSAAGTEAAKHCANSHPYGGRPLDLCPVSICFECWVETGWVGSPHEYLTGQRIPMEIIENRLLVQILTRPVTL